MISYQLELEDLFVIQPCSFFFIFQINYQFLTQKNIYRFSFLITESRSFAPQYSGHPHLPQTQTQETKNEKDLLVI